MDRKIANQKGMSILEILVIIAILSILASIGAIPFKNFNERQRIEQDTRNIYSLLQEGRLIAFSQKKEVYFDLTNNCLKDNTTNNNIKCIELKKTFNHNCTNAKIQINDRGVFETFCTVYHLTNLGPNYNCIKTFLTNVKIGYYDGQCTEK